MYLPESLWTRSFFLVAIIQAGIALGLEALVHTPKAEIMVY